MVFMATVRIDDDDDELLEKIRAHYILKGKKMTKKDILKELIKRKSSELTNLSVQAKSDSLPLDKDFAWIMLEKPLNWGISDTSITVDKYLYE
jgi:hypothetical protein